MGYKRNKLSLREPVTRAGKQGKFRLQINLNSAKECNQWLWRMTETPSLHHSRYKSDLEPGLLPYWAMRLHCLTQDPSADLMMAEAHSKTPGGPTGPDRLLCLRWERASYFIIRGSKRNRLPNLSCLLTKGFHFALFLYLKCFNTKRMFICS